MLQFTRDPVTELYFNCQSHSQNISVSPEDKALITAIYSNLQVLHPSSTAFAQWQKQNPEWCWWDKAVHLPKLRRGNPVEEHIESCNFSVWKPLNAPMSKSNWAARQPSCNQKVAGSTSEMGAMSNDRPANTTRTPGVLHPSVGWQSPSASSPQPQPCTMLFCAKIKPNLARPKRQGLKNEGEGWDSSCHHHSCFLIVSTGQNSCMMWNVAPKPEVTDCFPRHWEQHNSTS